MSGDDRRRQLLEVAIDLFSRKGFAGTTTKEIAAAAGVTEAIIFRHFATKHDLYQAILDYKCGQPGPNDWLLQAEAFMEAKDDRGLFHFILRGIVCSYAKNPQFERLLIHAALEGHEIALMHQQHISRTIGARLIEYIETRQAEGALRAGDPTAFLFALAGMPKFYALQKYMFRFDDPLFDDDKMIDQFLTILMNGLAAQ